MGFDTRDNEVGIGSLLMIQDGLPFDEFGHPWQAVFYFDADSKPTRLMTDEYGRALGYRPNAAGNALLDLAFVPLPEVVGIAAASELSGSRGLNPAPQPAPAEGADEGLDPAT